jgi:hypothetical protein
MDDEATEDDGERDLTGETVSFPFDRMTVQRFRETFPRARWNDAEKAWFVPGTTARRRLDRWLALEASRVSPYADARGRDAYEFEPILSPYLEVDDGGFRICTPYSRTVVEELRGVPLSRWDAGQKVWRVPFASYEELQRRWQTIEAAARRNEPEERRKRAEARRGTEEEVVARLKSAERRRRRIPFPADDLPPPARPVATVFHGIVVITDVTGEIVAPEDVAARYPGVDDDHVWALWRLPSLEELVHTWPAKTPPGEQERRRGWWLPTIDELRAARRAAKSRERRADPAASAEAERSP